MKLTVRQSGALAVVLAGSMALSACGDGAEEQVGAEEEQTLTVWAMGEEAQRLGAITDTYAAEQGNVTVEVTPVSWENVHQKMVAASAAGELPDVMQMGTTMMGEFVELGVLDPVDTERFAADDFFPAAWESAEVDGEAYGVPWYVDTRVLYYRTDLAEQAGITEPPADWAAMRELAAAYREEGVRWGASVQPGGTGAWQTLLPMYYSAGGQLLDDEGNPTLGSPEMVETLTEFARYFEEGLANDSVQPGYDVIPDFGNGDVGMFVSGPWMVRNIADGFPDLDGWAVAPVPADESSTSFIGGANLVISSDSPRKEAAAALIEHLTSPEQQRLWYEESSSLPANQAAWDGGELADSDELRVMRGALETSQAVPALPAWEELAEEISGAMESVSNGNATPEEAASELQSAAEDIVG
ncbi:sugar ABC transporter substrate-binding protein [Streptomyces radicis]|uniref:Extracellular solute-binding protein n=1 Tax=Streptomyces radicis TaxID=1750517 RepID=A0A3A9WCF4_9ACTN|nr:sugar ABC transporter substrate-binding protein [Streptomyces radicis]RKN07044.1 extracellular solute-binding protein [Streptomyces radicis]RKN15105.1 extracellular solute-binding protein [Streptomyces radicis]